MSASPPPRSTVPSMGCGYVVVAALVVAGLGLIAAVQSKHTPSRAVETWLGLAFGAMLCVGGLALIGPMQREVARARERVRREREKPGEPWMWDPRWTSPSGIPQSRRRHGAALIFFAVAALGVSLPVAILKLPEEVSRGDYGVLLVLPFTFIGGGILISAGLDRWRRRKYGTARFVPATLPVPLGGVLDGMVIVNRPVVAAGPGRAALECWCTTLTRTGGKTRTSEALDSHTEREIAAADWTTTAGESQLFVHLPLRGGSASTMTRLVQDNPTFEWRLRVTCPTPGADFVADFVLPVFEVTGAELAAASETVIASPRDLAEIWRVAGIREEAQPGAAGGHALVLPAKIGRIALGVPLAMTLIFGAIAVGLWVSPAPAFFAIFPGVFALLPALVLGSLWSGGGERIWIEGDTLCIERPVGKIRRLARRELQEFEVVQSVTAGRHRFYRIQTRSQPTATKRRGHLVSIVSLVRGDEAARALVAWMEERLAR